jgi:small subunit ribosomal protein S16
VLRIRLRRTGKRRQPSYRVVIADQRAPRDGDFIEVVGHYNPRTSPTTLELDEDRVRHWLENGAQPSETVHRLLHARGLTTVDRARGRRSGRVCACRGRRARRGRR